MKLTYTDIKNQFLRNIGKAGSTDTNLLADFNFNLGTRYQLVLAKMSDYMTQQPKTASTVESQQFYYYPPGIVNIESVVVTVGSVNYPLSVITSQRQWDVLNAIQIQPTAIPQFFFPRRDDFGIWPTPKDVYTITFNYHLRDRNLSIDDYTTGTVTLTNGSATVTGLSTTFTAGMVGRWFTVTSTSAYGQGYWYRIASYTSTTEITLETTWQGSDGGALSYKIGECPEFPDEGHVILVDGVTADFYGGMRNGQESSVLFNNKFWTGDQQNSSRQLSDPNIKGGLLGMMAFYADRNDTHLVNRNPRLSPAGAKVWAYSIT